MKLIIGKKLLPAEDDPEYDPDYDYLSMFDEYLARTSSTYEDTYIFSKDVLEKIPDYGFKKKWKTEWRNKGKYKKPDYFAEEEQRLKELVAASKNQTEVNGIKI